MKTILFMQKWLTVEVALAGVSLKTALVSNIQKTQAELEELQATLAQKQTEYNRLQRHTTSPRHLQHLLAKY